MSRLQYRPWLLGAALLSLVVASKPVLAISPTLFMIYGDGLQSPVIARAQDPSEFASYEFLWWRPGISHGHPETWTLPTGLSARPYLKVAVFWGLITFEDRAALFRVLGNPDLLKQLKPQDASQHGRLYLPTAAEPGAIVVTTPNMIRPDGARCETFTPPAEQSPCPVPVPATLEDFKVGWILNPADVATLKRLGVPGF